MHELTPCVLQLASSAVTHSFTRVWCTLWTHSTVLRRQNSLTILCLHGCDAVPCHACAAAPHKDTFQRPNPVSFW